LGASYQGSAKSAKLQTSLTFLDYNSNLKEHIADVINTADKPGYAPSRHQLRETKIFRVMEGRYGFQVGEKPFYEKGWWLPCRAAAPIPSQANGQAGTLEIMIAPGFDAEASFAGRAYVMRDGRAGAEGVQRKTPRGVLWPASPFGQELSIRISILLHATALRQQRMDAAASEIQINPCHPAAALAPRRGCRK
jgi:hypothetical protein